MVFKADTALAVELIALAAGTLLLLYAGKEQVCCKIFAKIVAYFVIIAAFLALLCTSYYTMRYWEDGHFSKPCPMMHMKERGMMRGMPGKERHEGMRERPMMRMMHERGAPEPAGE